MPPIPVAEPGAEVVAEPALEVAIVLATLERADDLARLLRQVVAQAPASSEIVVVDQSGPAQLARTAAQIEALADARVRHLPRAVRGLPGARNAGVAATSAPILLFFDDDVVLWPGCVVSHLSRYRDPTVGGVVGRIRERCLRSNARRTTNRLDRSGRIRTHLDGPDPVEIETLKGANMSWRRRALASVGGFDEAYAGTSLLEDADASERVRSVGWRLVYEPDAAVDHLHRATGGVRTEHADRTRWWRFHNTALFLRRHRGSLSLLPFAITFGAVAVRSAVEQRSAGAVAALLRAAVAGWRAGRGPVRSLAGIGNQDGRRTTSYIRPGIEP